jgi:hypothetical protein
MTALVLRSIHAAHRSASIGGHSRATFDARRPGAPDERRRPTPGLGRCAHSPTSLPTAARARGCAVPPADAAKREQAVQVRVLPRLCRLDRLRWPASQPLSLLLDLPPRRSAAARRSGQSLSGTDAGHRRDVPSRRRADGGASLQRLRHRAPESRRRRRQPDRPAAPAAGRQGAPGSGSRGGVDGVRRS